MTENDRKKKALYLYKYLIRANYHHRHINPTSYQELVDELMYISPNLYNDYTIWMCKQERKNEDYLE